MKMAQQFLIMLLSLGILVSIAEAKNADPKKADPKKADPKKVDPKNEKTTEVGPFVEVEISSRIMKYIDDYDKLKASMLKIYEKRDNNWGHNDLKKLKEKLAQIKLKVDETVLKENKSSESKANSVTKEIDDLEKKRENEKSEKVQEEIQKKIDRLMAIQSSLDTVNSQYGVFARYCNLLKKSPNETDLKGTALEYRDNNMPKIGAAKGYYAIVFCASKNKSSIAALSAVQGLGLDTVIAVVCDDDEAVFKKNFAEKEKAKVSYIRDGDFKLARQHKVMFLPTIYVGNAAGKCIYAMCGTSPKQLRLIKTLVKADQKGEKKEEEKKK